MRRLFAGATLALLVGCGAAPATQPRAASSKASQEPAPDAHAVAEPAADERSLAELTGRRGWLGVELAAAEPHEPGVRVRRVLRGSPAARAGLVPGDLILRVDGQGVREPAHVVRLVGERAAGHRLSLAVRRGDAERLLAVHLDARPDDDGMMRMSYVGAPAPALEALETVQGNLSPSLQDLRGKVVVIEFWASWCAVCRFLVPTINDWHARFSSQGALVLGVTTDSVGLASRTAYELRMSYPIASDQSGKTTEAYGAMALPTLFVLDKRGVVRDVMVGYTQGRVAQLEALIERLLDES
jgi:peroxiredoxin